MGKVSIIMPVHNAEKYVGEAIESVLAQTYPDFELLLVNDHSTDRSKEICEKYAKKDSRIVLLENDSDTRGPGPTRNIGLEHMSGDYVYFMDADDWIENRLLACAVRRMEETNADIVQFGIEYEYNSSNNILQYCRSDTDVLTKDAIKMNFFHFWKEHRNTLVIHFFGVETVKTIRFEHIISGEDHSFVVDALCNAERIAYIAELFYHYRYVEGSTSHRWSKETIACREIIWSHQKHFLDSLSLDSDSLAYAEIAFDNYIWALYQLSSNLCPLSYQEKRRQLRSLEEHMAFYKYRSIYPLQFQHGLARIKYALVKYNLEWAILRFGPIFLRFVRGE